MNITITTIDGTYVVPAEKQPDLIMWLQHNAIKIGGESIKEQGRPVGQIYSGRQLINESR